MRNFVLILLVSSLSFGASITKDFYFSKNDLKLRKVDGYDLVTMRDKPGPAHFVYPTEQGKPSIPFYSISLLIPATAEIKNVTILDYDRIQIPGEYLLYPVQRPRPTSQIEPIPFVQPDEIVYALSTEYPEKRVAMIRSGCKSGFRIAGVFLYPISYIPKERSLFLYRRMKVKIEYEEGIYHAEYLTPSQKALFSQDVKNLVINPEAIERFAPPLHQTDNPDTDYIIITSTGLKANFVPLVNWLRKTGLRADTISTTRINSNYTGRDLPEKIRNFIKDYYTNHSLKYVLLAGDNSIIPKRGVYARVSSIPPETDSSIPCDLYYFDLQYSWDGNQNNVFGDTFLISGRRDTVDLYYDLYGARWSVQTTAEVDTMIRKFMTYTKNPDTLYQKRLLLPAAFLWSSYSHRQSQDSIANLSPSGWTDRVIDQGTNTSLRWQARDSLNSGFGFAHLVAHGNDLGTWITGSVAQYYYTDPATQTNYNKLAIVNSNACYSGNFEYSDCLAEQMMKARGSAIGVMMNSRYGWGQPPWIGPSELLDVRFYHYLFTLDSIRIAHCHQAAKEYYRNSAMSQQVWRWCYYELNLLGEPSMMMWKDNPKPMTAAFTNPINTGSQSFTVTVSSQGSAVSQALVALWKGNEVYTRGLTNASGQATFTINPTTAGYMSVTVTAKNKIPCEDSCQVVLVTTDVGVTQILVPTGTIDSTGPIIPQARVKNNGTSSATFNVTFKIIGTSYNQTRAKTLNAGVEDTVNFSAWTPVRGTYTTRCSTYLAGDANPNNDTLSGSVTVQVHDVGVTQILAPSGTIDSTGPFTPQVRVRNYGSNTETFNVIFRIIGTSYNQTRSKTLGSGVEDTVNFPAWAPVRGTYTTRCSTYLANDIRRVNDTLSGSVTVQVKDVGVTQIITPSGTIDSTASIIPQAQVKNHGTNPATFNVTFKIGTSYNETRSKNLGAGVQDTVNFLAWTPTRGNHTTRCSTHLVGDANPINDTLSGSVMIRVRDVGATQIMVPTDTIDSTGQIIPQAQVQNFGTNTETLYVTFRIGTSYNETRSKTLGLGGPDTVNFPAWTPTRGNHTTRCSTYLAGDVNPTNNVISGSVTVRVRDVGVTQIVIPAGTIDSIQPITPQAQVRNYGTNTENFYVTFRIGTSYNETRSKTLGAGGPDTVNFPAWTPTPGNFMTRCSTYLIGDVNPGNDTLSGSVTVNGPDVGVTRILVPAGTIDSGQAITPACSVYNYNNRIETYRVRMRIGSFYDDTANVTGHLPGTYQYVTFPTWSVIQVGTHTVSCSTELTGDVDPSNNLGTGSVVVRGYQPPPSIWLSMTPIPAAPSGKRPKSGSCMAGLQATGSIYFLKATNRPDFYSFTPNTGIGIWTVLETIPKGDKASGDGKYPKKGASMAAYEDGKCVYILRGNNTVGFWKYQADTSAGQTIGWHKLNNIPPGTKKPKYGSGLVAVTKGGNDYLFAMKGSKTNEFYLYDITNNTWTQVASSPIGSSGKLGYKKGSCLTFDGDSFVYILKGYYGDFFKYDIENNSWHELTRYDYKIFMSREGKKKKPKDGAGLVYYNNNVYMLKGGN
ncbi:MAG: C25 family cysteine peptidase, partial [candidate division WOR-3 bacterium]|nr:C25 family cysteine peptidase [candidate division WOR-3 bacterium]